MKKIYLMMLAASTLLVFSCKSDKRSHSDAALDDEDKVEQAEEKKDFEPERKDFTFRTDVVVDDENTVEKVFVHIIPSRGKEVVEECQYTLPLDTTSWTGIGKIEEEDINFDGYPDLQVCAGPMNSSGNFVYDAWLWDNDKHAFVYAEGYGEAFDPEVYAAEEVIRGRFRLDENETCTVYRWEGNKLVEVSSETYNIYEKAEDDE